MDQLVFSASEFLRQEFERRRTRNPRFSLRAFAEKLNISSGRLSEYMSDKRTITPALAEKICVNLCLNEKTRTAFLGLVKASRRRPIRRLKLELSQLLGEWHLISTNSKHRFDFMIEPHPSASGEILVSYSNHKVILRKNFSSISESFIGGLLQATPMNVINEPQKFDDRLLVSSIYKCPPPSPLLCSGLSEIALLSDSRLYYRRDILTNYIEEGCFLSIADDLESYYIRQ